MKIVTSKNQTLAGKEADTIIGLAVIGAVTVIAGASIATGYVLEKLNQHYENKRWQK